MEKILFRYPAFALLWGVSLLSTLAIFIQSIAIGWQVYTVARLTHSIEQSSFLVGMVGLAQFLPMFALALLAGETADRYDRRVILLACSLLQTASAGAFIFMSLQAEPSLNILFVIAAMFGVSRAFSRPASTALAPTLVPAAILPRAVAWSTLGGQTGMVLGPWLGGILCASSVVWAYVAACGLFLVSVFAIISLLLMPIEAKAKHKPGPRLTMIREGIAYIWGNKLVFGAISLDLFAVLLGGVTALLPVYARDVLHIGADGFGLLRSGPALGGVLVTLWLSMRPIQRHVGKWMLYAVVVFGVATVVFAVSEILWLSMGMLVLLGAADSISVFVRQSLVQIVTPDAMRGRVSAVSNLFISASNELGEFESGVAARLIGPVGAAVFGGIGSIAVTGLWARLFPALRKADRLSAPEL